MAVDSEEEAAILHVLKARPDWEPHDSLKGREIISHTKHHTLNRSKSLLTCPNWHPITAKVVSIVSTAGSSILKIEKEKEIYSHDSR